MVANVITVLNKLAKKDSATGLDVWYVTKLYNIPFSTERVASVVGTTVSVGQTTNILLPFSDKFKHYREWVALEDRENYYTMSQGDLIFIDIDLNEIITPNNVIQIKNNYKPDVCSVASIFEVQKNPHIKYQLKVVGV